MSLPIVGQTFSRHRIAVYIFSTGGAFTLRLLVLPGLPRPARESRGEEPQQSGAAGFACECCDQPDAVPA